VDSIALTYSLLDPIMAVARPVTAFVTALAAGVAENLFRRPTAEIPSESAGGCSDACCASASARGAEALPAKKTAAAGIRAGLSFAFDDLMRDIAGWFVLGVVIAGAISALVPEWLISGVFGPGLVGYLAVLAGSLPMYVCASMSTPIAAALVAKGMSPGAALILLMAGPATNVATVTMVAGLLGKRTLAIYLAAIVFCTLLAAGVIDAIYSGFGISAQAVAGTGAAELLPAWLETVAALLLGLLIIRILVVKVMEGLPRRMQAESNGAPPEDPCSCREGDAGGT